MHDSRDSIHLVIGGDEYIIYGQHEHPAFSPFIHGASIILDQGTRDEVMRARPEYTRLLEDLRKGKAFADFVASDAYGPFSDHYNSAYYTAFYRLRERVYPSTTECITTVDVPIRELDKGIITVTFAGQQDHYAWEPFVFGARTALWYAVIGFLGDDPPLDAERQHLRMFAEKIGITDGSGFSEFVASRRIRRILQGTERDLIRQNAAQWTKDRISSYLESLDIAEDDKTDNG